MGVMSRRVLPACGNLCFFCPSLRPRSRHPVKRYKKMLAEIFPRNQDAEPNDRKIGKLCEYASRNPLRIPKITEYLEQKCYKELRNGNIGSVKVVLCIYKKLLSSCKEQMPLFSCSLLTVVRTLLEQTRDEEVQILGCNTLVDFISLQTENSHMFNLEGLIHKLCQLAEEMGDDERSLGLRSAGMQALAFMVSFIGEHSQLSMDLDMIISVILENYMDLEKGQEDTNMSKMVSFKSNPVTDYKLENMDISKSPSYWSMVCLCNIAKLAKETTTIRRVLEPLLNAFDSGNYWSPEKGVASSVLLFLQSRLEESGENCHVLVSSLIKHLDHKNVVKQQGMQVNMVNVATCLALHAKQQASGAMTAVIAELIKHLRKCLQNAAESNLSADESKQNSDLQHALENCIAELSKKVGDAGPILDMLAVVLEMISINVLVARTTASAILHAAHIISVVPNVSYHKKVFPDALFHQLLLAMSHTDYETRVETHSIFSVLLLRTLLLPWSDQHKETSFDGSKTARSQSISLQEEEGDKVEESLDNDLRKDVIHISHPSLSCQSLDSLKDGGIKSLCSLRLSSHQVNMLLTSLWIQATSTENTPANFEAMASTFNTTILFSLAKKSNHMALVRCFQLALSLRNLSLNQDGGWQLSRRRSIFTFASYLLIFSAKICNIPELIPVVKESLTAQMVDPYLRLEGDIKLRAGCSGFPQDEEVVAYGSDKDDSAALNLSTLVENDSRLKEIVITHFTSKFQTLSEEEQSNLKNEIESDFSRDDAHLLGAPLFMDTPGSSSPLNQIELPAFEEVELSEIAAFEGNSPGASGSHRTSLSTNTNPVDVLSINELLESVSETARQVASFSVSSLPVPYDQMMNQCEALVTGKQQKMSVLRSFKLQAVKAITFSEDDQKEELFLLKETEEADEDDQKALTVAQVQPQGLLRSCSREVEQNSFRLPPSSPYDKFLKAAGWIEIMEEVNCSLPVTKPTSDACPTEDAIRALLENLVDPLLPLKPSPSDVPSKALRESVAKQVHAVVLLYNYYHRKEHPHLECLSSESFRSLTTVIRPALLPHFKESGDGVLEQTVLLEKVVVDACSLSDSLGASSDISSLKKWPISKVAVLLVDSKKTCCYLQHSSITQGVWSLLEKPIEREITSAAGGQNEEAIFQKVAFSAIEEATGINHKDIVILERHLVQSLSEEKTTTQFYIMKCSSEDKFCGEFSVDEALNCMQGPLFEKSFSEWSTNSIVEYFHVLPYASLITDWFSRREDTEFVIEKEAEAVCDEFESNGKADESDIFDTPAKRSNDTNARKDAGPRSSPKVRKKVAPKTYSRILRGRIVPAVEPQVERLKAKNADNEMSPCKESYPNGERGGCEVGSGSNYHRERDNQRKKAVTDKLKSILRVNASSPVSAHDSNLNLEELQTTLLSKATSLSETALKVLHCKRDKLTLQQRDIEDEIAECDKRIKNISGMYVYTSLFAIALFLHELLNAYHGCCIGNWELQLETILETCNETYSRRIIQESHDKSACQSNKRMKLSEPTKSMCQKLDDICLENNWVLPNYRVSSTDGGYEAEVRIKETHFPHTICGDEKSDAEEARESAAACLLSRLHHNTRQQPSTSRHD
ncbi:unnamed protein product [Eruca vesicaria subsp. sativa]|uniref:Uncharacterized protein n=1 Tax=Eruca vesicaria subsp. sativa TaxID=29727 RepID=A0ABC8JBC9_ERUVS|nr:unnamed protein product [Eruca vesicaria subsp. sativa]